MPSLLNLGLLNLAAPLALLLPIAGQGDAHFDELEPTAALGEGGDPATNGPDYDEPRQSTYLQGDQSSPLEAFYQGQVATQVRIEQRVIFRITPRRQSNRNNLLAELPQRGLNTRFEEREMESCVPMNRISGVQTGNGNRLLLFLSDQRIVTINLDRTCRARDFYSGFYLEGSEDGQLCVNRDQLQSRSGAKCEVQRMRQLVALNE